MRSLNAPGYRYRKNAGTPSAVPCGVNTYTTGLAKQLACTPCPPGFVTDPDLPPGMQTSPAACVAPPGSYVANGVTEPCPAGSFTDAYNNASSCVSCESLFPGDAGTGISTPNAGSTSPLDCTSE